VPIASACPKSGSTLLALKKLEDNENLPRCAAFDFVNDSDITCWKMGGKFEISSDLYS